LKESALTLVEEANYDGNADLELLGRFIVIELAHDDSFSTIKQLLMRHEASRLLDIDDSTNEATKSQRTVRKVGL
jgi:hypothetical protein